MLVGIVVKSNGFEWGSYMLYAGAGLAGICWLWAIGEVISRDDLKPFQKRFWMIAVIAVPVFGGMVFHALHQEKNKLVS